MYKALGFVAVVALLMVALQPGFFADLFRGKPQTNSSDSLQVKASQPSPEARVHSYNPKEQTFEEMARPSLIARNVDKDKYKKASQMGNDGEFTQYADGYSAKDFGKAFEPESEMFPTDGNGNPQVEGIWKTLLELKFDIQYDHSIDDVVFKPLFTPAIQQLNGKEIEVVGYILPHEITKGASGAGKDGTMFMFSAYPAATCFFCGGAGPESVMEVFPKKPIPYSKAQVTIKGRLELNDRDKLRLAYILKDARMAQ